MGRRNKNYAAGALANKNARILKAALDQANKDGECRFLGPAEASIARLKGEYRIQILIKTRNRKALRNVLDTALKQAEVSGGDLRTYHVEIDPINLM